MAKTHSRPRAASRNASSDMAALRALSSVIQSRLQLAARAGLTYGGKRDLYEALGYKRQLTPADYIDRFRRGGIAKRIVTSFPNATWRGDIAVYEVENPNRTTQFELVWDEIAQRLKVWSVFRRADILAGLGHYAVILLGVPGEFETPAPVSVQPQQLVYLTPFGEEDARIHSLNEDQSSERFALPEMYSIKRIGGKANKGQRLVHWSRVIHIAEDVLDDDVNGTPRLEAVWNDLDNLDKIVGGGSEAFWKRVLQGLQLDIDKDMMVSDTAKKALKEQIDEWEHGMRRVFSTRGVKMKSLESNVSDFKPQIEGLISLLSGTTGIPQRILLGSERGELASTQDKENWDERVNERRNSWAGPHVIDQFVQRLQSFGTLPTPADGYLVRWPEIRSLDDNQRADLANKLAKLNETMGETVVTPEEIRTTVLGFDPLDPDEIDDEDEEEEDNSEGASDDESAGEDEGDTTDKNARERKPS